MTPRFYRRGLLLECPRRHCGVRRMRQAGMAKHYATHRMRYIAGRVA
jgi:hypothetical protein